MRASGRFPDTHANANPDTELYANTGPDTRVNANPDTELYTNAGPDTHANANCCRRHGAVQLA